MEFEILKTGKFIASNGKEIEFTEEDLTKIASSYNPANSEAPLVIGHPADNAPAYGWIESLTVTGDKLIAKAKQVVPEFLEAVKSGLFKKRSVSLNPDLTLRHVGFLGAALPAVKGLADLQFTEDPEALEFSYLWVPDSNVYVTNPIIENSPVNEEPKYLSDILTSVSSMKDILIQATTNLSLLQEKYDSFIQAQTAPAPVTKVNPIFSGNNYSENVEKAFKAGKLTVPMKEKLLSLITVNFSDEENPFDLDKFLTEFLESIPELILTEHIATPPDTKNEKHSNSANDFSGFTLDQEAVLINNEIISLMEKEKLPYKEAANIIFNQNK